MNSSNDEELLRDAFLAIDVLERNLKPGGPEVDSKKVLWYLNGLLDPEEAKVVKNNILNYRAWNDARLELAIEEGLECDLLGDDGGLDDANARPAIAKNIPSDKPRSFLLAIVAALFLLLLGSSWYAISTRHQLSQRQEADNLVNQFKMEVDTDIKAAELTLDSFFARFPDQRNLYTLMAYKLLIQSPTESPETLDLINRWSKEIDATGDDQLRQSWYQYCISVYEEQQLSELAEEAATVAHGLMLELPVEQWPFEFASKYASKQLIGNSSQEVLDWTRPVEGHLIQVASETYGPSLLVARVSAMASLGETTKATELVQKILDPKVCSELSPVEIAELNLLAAKLSIANKKVAEATKYIERTEAQQFYIQREHEIAYRISLAYTKVSALKSESVVNEKKIIEVIDDVKPYIDQLSIDSRSYQTEAVGLRVFEAESLQSLGDTNRAKLVVEALIAQLPKIINEERKFSILYAANRTLALSGDYKRAIDFGKQAFVFLNEDDSRDSVVRASNLNFYNGFAESKLLNWEPAASYFNKAAVNPYFPSFSALAKTNQITCLSAIPERVDEARRLFAEFTEDLPDETKEWILALKQQQQVIVGDIALAAR